MAHYERYNGSFATINGDLFTVVILQESNEEFAAIGDLNFPADEPLTIEWEEVSKEKPLCPSTATLTLLSPGDRTYEDLYTENPTAILLEVYKNGALYWSGCLDAEFYEEPYSTYDGYEVSLTFSDFGVLDRLNYTAEGKRSVLDIITECLDRMAIGYKTLNVGLISTTLSDGEQLTLDNIFVDSDNFYDEDEVPCTLSDVLDGVLQPLALRIIQRAGSVYVYDLNALYNAADLDAVRWMSDDQVLSVDKVYNELSITWSTYARSGNLSAEECWVETSTISDTIAQSALDNLSGVAVNDDVTAYAYHASTDLSEWLSDDTDVGFALLTSTDGVNADLVHDDARFFKLVPREDGEECEGIASRWTAYQATSSSGLSSSGKGYRPTFGKYSNTSVPSAEIFRSAAATIPQVSDTDALRLRVGLNMLLDVRFNPFESAADLNSGYKQETHYNSWQKFGNFVYCPVRLILTPDGDSDYVYIWDNRAVVSVAYGYPRKTLSSTLGSWVKVNAAEVDTTTAHGYFCWYDTDDRVDSCGVMGWNFNKPAINPHKKALTAALRAVDAGQIIPYPEVGGTLQLRVYGSTWVVRGENSNVTDDTADHQLQLPGKITHLWFKTPEIEIQNNSQWDTEIDTDDVCYTATLDAAAADDLSIETICGTAAEGIPTARGAYFDSEGNQVTELTRAGRTTQAENLLIGTLYSQFGSRKTKLTGTLRANPYLAFYENCQENRIFLTAGFIEDCRMNTAEATLIELRPDEYTEEGETITDITEPTLDDLYQRTLGDDDGIMLDDDLYLTTEQDDFFIIE